MAVTLSATTLRTKSPWAAAEPLDDSWSEVRQEDVGLIDQLQHDVQAPRVAQVHRHGPLVAI